MTGINGAGGWNGFGITGVGGSNGFGISGAGCRGLGGKSDGG